MTKLTDERLEAIRDLTDCGWQDVGIGVVVNALDDTLEHIDAQAAEIAELRRDRDNWFKQFEEAHKESKRAKQRAEKAEAELADERGWNNQRRRVADRIGEALDGVRLKRATGEPAENDGDAVWRVVRELEQAGAAQKIAEIERDAARMLQECGHPASISERVTSLNEAGECVGQDEWCQLCATTAERDSLEAERDALRERMRRVWHHPTCPIFEYSNGNCNCGLREG